MKHLRLARELHPTTEVIGVVRAGGCLSPGEDRRPVIFHDANPRHTTLLVRSQPGRNPTLRRMRTLVKELFAGVTVFDAHSMEEHLDWPCSRCVYRPHC